MFDFLKKSLRLKVIAFYAVDVIVFSIISFFVIYILSDLKSKYQNINNNINPYVESVQKLSTQISLCRLLSADWLYSQTTKDRDKRELKDLLIRDYPKLKRELQIAFERLDKSKFSEKQLSEILAKTDNLMKSSKLITETLTFFEDYDDATKRFTAESEFEDNLIVLYNEIQTDLDSYMSELLNVQTEFLRKFESQSDKSRYIIILVALLAAIGSISVAFILSKSIVKPINNVKDTLLELSKGKIVKLDTGMRQDEIGQMTQALGTMNKSLINNADFANKIGNGEFQTNFIAASGDDVIGNALLKMRKDLITLETERERRWQMQSLSEHSPDLILRFQPNGNIIYYNNALRRFTNTEESYYIGKSIFSEAGFLPVDYVSILKQIVKKIHETKQKQTFEYTTPNGLFSGQVNLIPEFNSNNELESILSATTDVTRLKQIQIDLEKTNQKVQESIQYAQRIQDAFIQIGDKLEDAFELSLLFFKPRDIVSGDFPYFKRVGNKVFLAAADCTGHGVPGAFISLISFFVLDEIISEYWSSKPDTVLEKVHTRMRDMLNQKENSTMQDGMDIALLKMDLDTNEIHFSGAHQPLFIYRNKEFIVLDGTNRAIGGTLFNEEKAFEPHHLHLLKGDFVTMFSDGVTDQLGGPTKRKLLQKGLRELISRRSNYPDFHAFKTIFLDELQNYSKDMRQIDDCLLISFEVK
jgi:serine phosphatase RsbU (regulator of sigma subunit)/PAS domain-containing protein